MRGGQAVKGNATARTVSRWLDPAPTLGGFDGNWGE
jgi:hypothetical protein